MSERMRKVNSLLSTEIGRALGPGTVTGVLATVTAVETTSDLTEAMVWVSVIPETGEAWEAVQQQQGAVQQAVAARVRLKRTPRLQLRRDMGGAHAERIELLLRNDH